MPVDEEMGRMMCEMKILNDDWWVELNQIGAQRPRQKAHLIITSGIEDRTLHVKIFISYTTTRMVNIKIQCNRTSWDTYLLLALFDLLKELVLARCAHVDGQKFFLHPMNVGSEDILVLFDKIYNDQIFDEVYLLSTRRNCNRIECQEKSFFSQVCQHDF